LDIGCGSGSFGAHLFSKKLLTVCIAMYELYGSQDQLALEEGKDVESPYYQPLLSCIGGTLSRRSIPILNQLTRWPARMMPRSNLLSIHGVFAE